MAGEASSRALARTIRPRRFHRRPRRFAGGRISRASKIDPRGRTGMPQPSAGGHDHAPHTIWTGGAAPVPAAGRADRQHRLERNAGLRCEQPQRAALLYFRRSQAGSLTALRTRSCSCTLTHSILRSRRGCSLPTCRTTGARSPMSQARTNCRRKGQRGSIAGAATSCSTETGFRNEGRCEFRPRNCRSSAFRRRRASAFPRTRWSRLTPTAFTRVRDPTGLQCEPSCGHIAAGRPFFPGLAPTFFPGAR
jgi:hypothetical protein